LPSSIYPLTVSINTAGTISSAAVAGGGTGYTAGETVKLTGATSGSIDGTATVTVTAGVVQTITIVNAGTNYINGETLALTGLTSGATNATGTATTTTISASSNVLSSNVAITSELLRPTGGGIVRLSFGLSFATSPSAVSIFNNGKLKGTLNADNSNNLISDGYYRFDIDVEAGDAINLQASQVINVIRFLRVHLVLLGA